MALVMNGGVSLAVWMGGVTHELNRLRLAAGGVEPDDEREKAVHRAWKAILGPQSRVVVDTVAGTSAGGLNGTLLATAVAHGSDLTGLKEVWLERASLEPGKLLRRNPRDANSLLDGGYFTDSINEVLAKIAHGKTGQFPVQDVTLLVTATGIGNNLAPMLMEGGVSDSYRDSRRVYRFQRRARHDGNELSNDFAVPKEPARNGEPSGPLAGAARASASFPTAFTPVLEDEDLQKFRAPGSANVGRSRLMDGGVLDNAPFGPLLAALQERPVDALFDRVVLYVVPSASARKIAQLGNDELPDVGNVLSAVASTVREPDQRLDVTLLEHAFEQMSYQNSTTHAVLAGALCGRQPDANVLIGAASALLDTYRTGRGEAVHRWLAGIGRPVDLTRPRPISGNPDVIPVVPPPRRTGAPPLTPGKPWVWGSSTADRVLRWLGRALVQIASDRGPETSEDKELATTFAAIGRSQRWVYEVDGEIVQALTDAVQPGDDLDTRLKTFKKILTAYDTEDPFGNAVRDAAVAVAAWLSSPNDTVDPDDVIAAALAIEVVSSVFAWGGDEGDVPMFTYLQVSPLARSLVSVPPLNKDPGQVGYDDQNQQWAARKLYGERWGHFGAFATKKGRQHDWRWGRLDGASALVHMILGPNAAEDDRTTDLVNAILAAEYSGEGPPPSPTELRNAVERDAERVMDLEMGDLYRLMLEDGGGEEARELLLATVPEVLGETPVIGGKGEFFARVITKGTEAYLDVSEAGSDVKARCRDILQGAWRHLPWASKEVDDS
ncbi:DUF3376 domain-containing protein [Nocardioides pinisoli]|uniref:DUF3376 domain-containing protein n=1 Tax=Nocardioides pinisoli TaxID=2950279 RepID=A0ABT1L1W0_9ACTN|nr:DUF3376 domain-containing protein [Nocardioides pinisoli]MCP3424015.1 DUF3376 domain-containing protein [Nocardioides pinisoli]